MATEKQTKGRQRRRIKKVYNDKHIIGFLFSIGLVLNLLLGTLLFSLVSLQIPDIKSVAHYTPLQTSYIYDTDGRIVERIFIENRTVVPYKKIPSLVGRAFVAAEDGRFFEHPGLDFFSVIRAAINNVREGRRGQGGSTITQQVAKSLLLTPEKTYLRKFKEAILAWRIDTLLSKEEILYIYLNQIYLGAGAHGVEAASQAYFDKHVWELDLAEMAMLAGLPQAPSRYSPLKHLERAVARQKYVLNRMAADGYISAYQAKTAFEANLSFGREDTAPLRQIGYYTQVVKKQAEAYLDKPLTEAAVHIYTNLDVSMQEKAIMALKRGVAGVDNKVSTIVPQGALVCLEACTGRVRALAGGIDYIVSPFNRAYQAKRPAGSVFKPMVYGTAIENGWTLESTILDAPFVMRGGDGKMWKPKNFSGRHHGEVTLLEAITKSYNIPAIKLLKNVGVKKVHKFTKSAGITSKLTPDLSLALGAIDVSPLEMTSAYSPFICGGVYVPPIFIDRIVDSKGRKVEITAPKAVKVMSSNGALFVNQMLRSVVAKGTGKRVQGLPGETGGKTGTTNDNRDAWFIGFNDKILTGVWIGHDDNKSLGKGNNGGKTAAPVWLDYMKSIE